MEKPNLLWYEDDELLIGLSDTPHVCMRLIVPSATCDEILSMKKYPFICKTELKVTIFDKIKTKIYKFTIPEGYCYDGASIPGPFWCLIGSNTDNSFLIPALLHDTLCEHHEYIDNDRALSTRVFDALLVVSKVAPIKRFLMKYSVATFQTLFCRW